MTNNPNENNESAVVLSNPANDSILAIKTMMETTKGVAEAFYEYAMIPASYTPSKKEQSKWAQENGLPAMPPEEVKKVTVGRAMIAMISGAKKGWDPDESLRNQYIVNGMPSVYGAGIARVLADQGVKFKVEFKGSIIDKNLRCIVTDLEDENRTLTYGQDDAYMAGWWPGYVDDNGLLLAKNPWYKGPNQGQDEYIRTQHCLYPKDHLKWKALSRFAGLYATGSGASFYSDVEPPEQAASFVDVTNDFKPPSAIAENIPKSVKKLTEDEYAEAYNKLLKRMNGFSYNSKEELYEEKLDALQEFKDAYPGMGNESGTTGYKFNRMLYKYTQLVQEQEGTPEPEPEPEEEDEDDAMAMMAEATMEDEEPEPEEEDQEEQAPEEAPQSQEESPILAFVMNSEDFGNLLNEAEKERAVELSDKPYNNPEVQEGWKKLSALIEGRKKMWTDILEPVPTDNVERMMFMVGGGDRGFAAAAKAKGFSDKDIKVFKSLPYIIELCKE